MPIKKYIENWMHDVSSKYPKSVFKYVLFENQLHIIKYSDYLKEDAEFVKHISDLIKYGDECKEDIVVLMDSDDYFEIDSFDITYNINDSILKCIFDNIAYEPIKNTQNEFTKVGVDSIIKSSYQSSFNVNIMTDNYALAA